MLRPYEWRFTRTLHAMSLHNGMPMVVTLIGIFVLDNYEVDGFVTGALLTDAIVELVEGGLGLDEALGDELFAHQDAAIVDVVDAVACF